VPLIKPSAIAGIARNTPFKPSCAGELLNKYSRQLVAVICISVGNKQAQPELAKVAVAEKQRGGWSAPRENSACRSWKPSCVRTVEERERMAESRQ